MEKLIKHIIKKIIKFFIDLFNTIHSMLNLWRFISFKNSFREYSANKTKPLIVMGNGPSLMEVIKYYTSTLNKCDICVVNNFAMSDFYEILKPKYYILADEGYWLNKEETYNAIIESRNFVFGKLKESTQWPILLFVPSPIYKKGYFQEVFLGNINIKVLPMNKYPFIGFNRIKYFLFRNNLSMPQIQNVLVASLFIGLNLSYKKIYLIGAENNWTQFMRVNNLNQVCLTDNHFYNSEITPMVPWLKSTGEPYKSYEFLLDVSKTLAGYFEIEKYALIKGAKIYNCCDNSFIDAFERRSINDIIFADYNDSSRL